MNKQIKQFIQGIQAAIKNNPNTSMNIIKEGNEFFLEFNTKFNGVNDSFIIPAKDVKNFKQVQQQLHIA